MKPFWVLQSEHAPASFEAQAGQLMFPLAFEGIFTTNDPAVGEDEAWLLEGRRKN